MSCRPRDSRRRNGLAQRRKSRSSTRWIPDGELIEQFLTTDVLVRIFGSSSLRRVLRVLIRVKRAKKRTPETLGQMAWHCRQGNDDPPDRNYHHLTPRCRKKEPYRGDGWRNRLLIKKERHRVLHYECGVRTLEEIILILYRCLRARSRRNDLLVAEAAITLVVADYVLRKRFGCAPYDYQRLRHGRAS